MFLEHSQVYIFEASSSLTLWFITLVESWHGGESGDQDCEEASPDRAYRDQAQQGQCLDQEFVSNSNIYIP